MTTPTNPVLDDIVDLVPLAGAAVGNYVVRYVIDNAGEVREPGAGNMPGATVADPMNISVMLAMAPISLTGIDLTGATDMDLATVENTTIATSDNGRISFSPANYRPVCPCNIEQIGRTADVRAFRFQNCNVGSGTQIQHVISAAGAFRMP